MSSYPQSCHPDLVLDHNFDDALGPNARKGRDGVDEWRSRDIPQPDLYERIASSALVHEDQDRS